MHAGLTEGFGLVADEHAHLSVVKQCEPAALDTKLLELDPLRSMSLFAQPAAEGVHRADVGIARHRLDAALAKAHDELLERDLGGRTAASWATTAA
jgi:hypothetical protein